MKIHPDPMANPASAHRAVGLAAAVLVGVLGYFGIGLHPWWPAAWLIPFLAFIAAAYLAGWKRLLVVTLAAFAGSLNTWAYLSILPPPVRILVLLIPALALGASATLFGWLAGRGRAWLALAVPGAVYVSYEYLYSLVSPHGTFGAWGYTQVDCRTILQLSSLGGLWLIDGLIFFVGAGVALLVTPARGARKRTLVLATFLPVVLAVGWGAWRLRAPSGGASLRVGLLASDRSENMWYRELPNSEVVLQHYVARIPRLAQAGAELILLPEHLIAWREAGPDANGSRIDRVLLETAANNHVRIVLGVDRFDAQGKAWNEARAYLPDGRVIRYDKHHLLPGPESLFTPGTMYTVFDAAERRLGLAICKDLDFPATGREYAQRDVGALIVPAYDFTVDGWLHGRMAVERAVEAGCSLVRCAKLGRLTVSDRRGRILADAASNDGEFAQVVATVPVQAERTFYARAGDWFAWLSIAAVVFGALRVVTAQRVAS